jgi:AcrR family transcriptional regulator
MGFSKQKYCMLESDQRSLPGDQTMPKGIPLTQEEINRRRHDIAQSAVPLFLEHGFIETSMNSIARAAGTGKSTLYDYFGNKDDILAYILYEHIEEIIERAEIILRTDQNAREQLVRLMNAHLEHLLENKAFYMRISIEALGMSKNSQQEVQLERYKFQDLVQSLIEKGIDQGVFRPVNPMMVTKTLFALMTPVVYTSRPVGSPQEMLKMGLDLILNGLER